MSYLDEFENYDDYVDEVMQGGGHKDELLSEDEFLYYKKGWEIKRLK